jgi:integrase
MGTEKRAYGRGGLYKRGRVWWIKYYVGRYPVRESARTRDKKKAEDLLRQRLAESELNQLPEPSSRRLTIQEVLQYLLSDYRFRKRASLSQLESRVSKHLVPLLGPIRAADFGQRQVEAYVQVRRKQNASEASINRELEHLRAAFRLAVEHEALTKVPKIRMLAEDNVRTGFLEHNQYGLLKTLLPAYLVPIFVVGYHVGCRLGELMKLRWDQVDFDAAQIWLERRQTKGRMARVLPIYGEMMPVLVASLEDRNANHPECAYVFHHQGRRIVDFRKAWVKRARPPAIRLFDFTTFDGVQSETWTAPALHARPSAKSSATRQTRCLSDIGS